MNAIRIRKHLNAPIPEFPELTPMVGMTVEMMVLQEAERIRMPAYDFFHGPTADELAAQQGVHPIDTLEQLQASDELRDAFEGFEDTFRLWRQGNASAECNAV
ncbi:MAG TPA: hypothetical protein VFC78_14625 [Tepidisphaeraceae bacterium]|nr:hypothetical protein [Tepidisphaeraceae bacterium]